MPMMTRRSLVLISCFCGQRVSYCPGAGVQIDPSHMAPTARSPSGNEGMENAPGSLTLAELCHCGGESCGLHPNGQTLATTRPFFTGRGTVESSSPCKVAPRLSLTDNSFVCFA